MGIYGGFIGFDVDLMDLKFEVLMGSHGDVIEYMETRQLVDSPPLQGW